MLDFLSMIGTPVAAPLPTGMTEAQANACFKRTAATAGNRQYKKAKHEELLDTVGGDREALKTICLWVPRKTNQKLLGMALDRKLKSEIGNDAGQAMTSFEADYEATEYDLEEIEVERARHPKEEVEFAKLQRRFREQTPSIQGFFHKPFIKSGDRRQRTVLPAPLGDFNWVDADPEVTREQQIAQSLAKLRADRPIRNVRESAQ